MKIKLIEMRIIRDLMLTKSYTKSAERLGIAQASISKSVASFEEKIGMKVIDRTTRPITLTNFGTELLPYLEKTLEINNDFISFVDSFKTKPSGVVHVYAPTGILIYFTNEIVHRFHEQNPEVKIAFTTLNPAFADYYSGTNFHDNCDVMFAHIFPKNDNLIVKKLQSLELNIYSTDDFYENNRFDNLKELSEKPFLLLDSHGKERGINYYNITNTSTHETSMLFVRGDFIFDNTFCAVNCCNHGLGYLVTSPLMIPEGSPLKPRLPENMKMYFDIYMIYKTKDFRPYRTQLLVDFFSDYFTHNKL